MKVQTQISDSVVEKMRKELLIELQAIKPLSDLFVLKSELEG